MHDARIFLIESDQIIAQSTASLLNARGFAVEVFASVEAFTVELVRSAQLDGSKRCVLINAHLNGHNGKPVLQTMLKVDPTLRVILYGAHASGESVINAWRNGAAMFLMYPFSVKELALVIENSLKVTTDTDTNHYQSDAALIRRQYRTLTRREREVLLLVARGLKNQEIARQLQISLPTVKMHRHNLMHKLQAKTVVQAVNFHNQYQKLPSTD